jgi:hypothetical protein
MDLPERWLRTIIFDISSNRYAGNNRLIRKLVRSYGGFPASGPLRGVEFRKDSPTCRISGEMRHGGADYRFFYHGN